MQERRLEGAVGEGGLPQTLVGTTSQSACQHLSRLPPRRHVGASGLALVQQTLSAHPCPLAGVAISAKRSGRSCYWLHCRDEVRRPPAQALRKSRHRHNRRQQRGRGDAPRHLAPLAIGRPRRPRRPHHPPGKGEGSGGEGEVEVRNEGGSEGEERGVRVSMRG